MCLEGDIARGAAKVLDKFRRLGPRLAGQCDRIDDRQMTVHGKHVHHAYALVDQRIGLVDDAERRLSSIHEGQRRAHAVGAHQAIRHIIPDSQRGQGLARVSADGHRVELYACDYYTGDPDLRPLRWSVSDPRCRSFWGARAPDSWYDESSLVLGPDGAAVETSDASVDERRARSEVMA